MSLTVGSLFSGIGGLDLGLERAGFRVLWQVEKNDYCRRVLAKHWPTVTRYEDVHDVGSRNLQPVDLLCGGFPCQDISHAGRRAGLIKGVTRSGLWGEYERIIGEIRPRFVLVENVAALLVRGLDVVLADLATLGYDAVWDCIPASYVGAPHRRDRIWIVGYARGESFHWLHGGGGRAGSGSPAHADRSAISADAVADASSGGLREERNVRVRESDARDSGGTADDLADAERAGLEGYPWHGARDGGRQEPRGSIAARRLCGLRDAERWWSTEPDVGRVAHGIPARVDRLTGLGNAVVPFAGEWIGWSIREAIGDV